jgi:hypothetical protein
LVQRTAIRWCHCTSQNEPAVDLRRDVALVAVEALTLAKRACPPTRHWILSGARFPVHRLELRLELIVEQCPHIMQEGEQLLRPLPITDPGLSQKHARGITYDHVRLRRIPA